MNPLQDVLVLTTGKVSFADIKPEHFIEMFNQLLVEAKEEHERKVSNPLYVYGDLFEDKCSKIKHLGFVRECLGTLQSVRDSDELRAVYDEYSPILQQFYYEIGQLDMRPFEIIKAYMKTDEYANLPELKKKIVDEYYDAYVKSGVELPIDQKEELQQVHKDLDALQTKFSRNITDNEKLHSWRFETKEELVGLSDEMLTTASGLATREGVSGYLFTMSDGNYGELIQYADDQKIRKSVYKQSLDVAVSGEFDNREIVKQIVELKSKAAKILGFNTYADCVLEDMMAKTPDTVLNFLQKLGDASIGHAKQEKAEMDVYGEILLGRKPSFWDTSYVSTKLKKEKFSVDPVKVQEYLRLDTVMTGMFAVIKTLFNVEFKDAIKSKTASADEKWHEDVQILDVFENGKYISTLYVDLFKRPNKRNGAWMSPFKSYHKHDDGFEELSITNVVCNFVKAGENEVQTVKFDDIETLFHEFGHALHHMLSKIPKSDLGGINVEWDAVELPSQFMENFCWDWSFLEGLTSHNITSEKMPKEMFDKMYEAKNYNAGIGLIRQVVLGELDMRSYNQSGNIVSPMDIEADTREKWKYCPYNKKAGIVPEFSHIFDGGYSALYYSYAWAEVLSSDIYEAIKENPDLIHTYKKEVLEMGGSRDMMDNFKAVIGREPDVGALLRARGL